MIGNSKTIPISPNDDFFRCIDALLFQEFITLLDILISKGSRETSGTSGSVVSRSVKPQDIIEIDHATSIVHPLIYQGKMYRQNMAKF